MFARCASFRKDIAIGLKLVGWNPNFEATSLAEMQIKEADATPRAELRFVEAKWPRLPHYPGFMPGTQARGFGRASFLARTYVSIAPRPLSPRAGARTTPPAGA